MSQRKSFWMKEFFSKNIFINNHPGRKYYLFFKRHPEISQKHAEYVNKARGAVNEHKIRSWFTEVSSALKDHLSVLKDPNRVFNF